MSPSGRGARARILAAARERFADPGINATGVAELCAAAGVSKRTLYAHFASKDEVVVAYLRELAADPSVEPWRTLERSDLTPRARLLEVFAAIGEGPRPLRGDPFLAAAVEVADPADPARRVVARHQAQLAARLGELVAEIGARGPERLGRRLAVLYAGAGAAVLIADDPAPAADAMATAGDLLEAAVD